MKEIFSGVFREKNALYTKSLAPGTKAYKEHIYITHNEEYREWNVYRSKAAGAIAKGLREFPLTEHSLVLYLGAASGTTVSHFSDICRSGLVFAVEFSSVEMKKLVSVAEKRPNIAPILADARSPKTYKDLVGNVSVLYQDVAQRDQTRIFLENAQFLEKGGYGMLCLKARSISSSRPVEDIYREEVENLKQTFLIREQIRLDPYDKEHLFVLCQKK